MGAADPVGFFAYPGKPSRLAPEGCYVHLLATPAQECAQALEALCDGVGANIFMSELQKPNRPDRPTGAITLDSIASAIGALLPEIAIVVDESVTTGRGFLPFTAGAAPHDWLQNRGGAIGLGLPMATGAAIACPDRKVICLESDGSGMYCPQALWTQAREGLDVTTLVFATRSYNFLKGELAGVGAGHPGPTAIDMLSLDRPIIDWVAFSKSLGVEAVQADNANDRCKALEAAIGVEGPSLVEIVI